jgi:hypothetical protein
MATKSAVTAFTLVSGHVFSVVMYGSEPIPSDYRWGAYRRFQNGDTTFHIFQRGGILSDAAVKDIIEAHRNGQVRKVGDQGS